MHLRSEPQQSFADDDNHVSGGDNEGDGTRTGIRIENLMTHDYMSFP